MSFIQITAGAYGLDAGNGRIRTIRRGERCEVADDEAARLVGLGIAARVVSEGAPAPAGGAGRAAEGSAPPKMENAAEGLELGESGLDPEQLRKLTNAQLRELAEDMGLDTSAMKVKEDFVAAISAVPVDAVDGEIEVIGDNGGETPPELGAAGPVE